MKQTDHWEKYLEVPELSRDEFENLQSMQLQIKEVYKKKRGNVEPVRQDQLGETR